MAEALSGSGSEEARVCVQVLNDEDIKVFEATDSLNWGSVNQGWGVSLVSPSVSRNQSRSTWFY